MTRSCRSPCSPWHGDVQAHCHAVRARLADLDVLAEAITDPRVDRRVVIDQGADLRRSLLREAEQAHRAFGSPGSTQRRPPCGDGHRQVPLGALEACRRRGRLAPRWTRLLMLCGRWRRHWSARRTCKTSLSGRSPRAGDSCSSPTGWPPRWTRPASGSRCCRQADSHWPLDPPTAERSRVTSSPVRVNSAGPAWTTRQPARSDIGPPVDVTLAVRGQSRPGGPVGGPEGSAPPDG